MMDKKLIMKNITKVFGGVIALDDVSIDLNENEILCLVGENGAGKSTLMKVLSGNYAHNSYSGEIFVDGEKVQFANTRDSEKSGIEMIYQEISMHDELSIAENVFLGNLPTSRKMIVDWKEINDETQKVLEQFNLSKSPKDKLGTLSTSQKQLVSIARALVKKPQILVLDEPTSAITENDSEKLFSILEMLKTEGISSIYISHKLKEVYRLADRITILRDGKVINTYNKDDIKPSRVITDMVGRDIKEMFPKVHFDRGEEVLRVEDMTVPSTHVRNKNLVENINFSLHKSEILGIGGLVGAGRSELVNAVFGGLKTDGTEKVYLNGQKIDIKSPADAIAAGIGLLTESRKVNGFVPTMSIKENLALASLNQISRNRIIRKDLEKTQVSKIFDRLRIKAPSSDVNILSLSGGNQQKVVLGKWLMQDMDVIILDEPTRGIDVGAKVEIYQIMTDLARRGVGIIMISSELPELLEMCDRIIVLSEGKMAAELDEGSMSEERYMEAATGCLN